VARSSNGASLYNGSTLNGASDGGRSRKDEQFEASLLEHYVTLKRYLAASLRDEQGNPRQNRALDKLLRLSAIQFQELSTDVFDELQRRQVPGRRGPNDGPAGPPPYLLPNDAFHPKRNQARQKLSTLPPPRFRDLATDVFYELERRFPRFAGGDISRTDSPASMRGPPSRIGTPVDAPQPYRPGSRGGLRIRRPSEASVMSSVSAVSGYPRSDSRNGSRAMNGMSSPGLPPNDYGRPQPKTFQSNTIVPNKSTMVENDDDPTGGEDDEDEDAFRLESAARRRKSKKSSGERSEVSNRSRSNECY
jgi:Spa2 homology domain (SHD) of GIT